MNNTALKEYLTQKEFPIIKKEHKKYLLYEGNQDHHVYILKSGIIKTSVVSRDGREFNLEYINDLEVVSLLKDEYSQFIDAPFNIRVESQSAELYQIDRVEFWKDINQNVDLQIYVKNYYRERLLKAMKRTQQMLMNGKLGAICTQIYDLYDKFGVSTPTGTLIDFIVTNDDLAHFCGINAASSVSRIMNQLKNDGAIEMRDHKIFVKNIELIKDNIIF